MTFNHAAQLSAEYISRVDTLDKEHGFTPLQDARSTRFERLVRQGTLLDVHIHSEQHARMICERNHIEMVRTTANHWRGLFGVA